MQDLPESVRERLAAAQGASTDHPDADQLTAFAEGALAGRERQGVIAHLASCAQCRDILALAASVNESTLPVAVAPQRARLQWFTIRRFAVAAAALVIVVGAISVRWPVQRRESRSDAAPVEKRSDTAKKETAPEETPPVSSENKPAGANLVAQAKKAAEPKAPAEPKRELDKADTGDGRDRDLLAAVRRPSQGVIGGLKQSGPMASANTVQQENQRPQAAPPPLQNSANFEQQRAADNRQNSAQNSVDAANDQVAATNQTVNSQVNQNERSLSTEVATVNRPGAVQTPAKQNVEVVPGAQAKVARLESSPLAAPKPMARTMAAMPAGDFEWTISPEGYLLRSALQPPSWSRVAVPGNRRVRSVSATGRDLWVATIPGQLYRSSDAGVTWAEAPLPAPGRAIDVHFSDPLRGSLTLQASLEEPGSSGILHKDSAQVQKRKADTQVWTTEDGGRTWSKQH
jgi:hypothetical protein